MQRFLFVCNDFIGSTMAGPGIRYWEMAHALERKDHGAIVLARHLERGFSSGQIEFVGTASVSNLIGCIRRSHCVIQPGRPLPILLSLMFHKKLIFDQYDPVILELMEKKAVSIHEKIRKSLMLILRKIRQRIIMRFGDGFLVANERQKDLLMGQLTALGYVHKLDCVTVLPFGLPRAGPVKTRPVMRGATIKNTDFLLVWGGGVWEWFDPSTLLLALAKIKAQRDDIKAYFPGLRAPSPDSRKMAIADEFIAQARSLGLLGATVFVNTEWTSYEQRADYLLESDAGISLHKESTEARFSFRTRMLDYVWAGLPIIASTGDSWAELIEKRGLGIMVLPGDVDGVANAIIKMADDHSFSKHCRERVQAIAEEYAWDILVDRLVRHTADHPPA